MSTEFLALLTSSFFALACNTPFWAAAFAGRVGSNPATWAFGVALSIALISLYYLILCLVLIERIAKLQLSALILATAVATYYTNTFSVYLDPSMLRNVFATEFKESVELLTWGIVPHLAAFAGLPLLILWHIRLERRSLKRAFLIRLGSIAGAGMLATGALVFAYQDLSSLMRNRKEVRYLITPGNFLYSSVRVLAERIGPSREARSVVGGDARLGSGWSSRDKPVLFVLVIGETARAANWGLNLYPRQTTLELSRLDVVNFNEVTACGTDTETSLPCMFSAVGRRNYSAARIRNSDSLLHLLNRAGFQVIWLDNNTGCKKVCAGLPEERLDKMMLPDLCSSGRCLDEVLLQGLDGVVRDNEGNLLVVLHQLGNHGPSYYKRYPDAFRRFVPTCDSAELRQCDREQIVNAYDNALLYTDYLLSKTITFLKSQNTKYDTAMLYISDHGESLGENGLYLHGIPYPIAPKVQREVPMVLWLSPGFVNSFGIDEACMRVRARQPTSHDNLFHSILGLLQVETNVLEPTLDISHECRAR